FQPRLKSDHAGSAVAAQTHAKQTGRRRRRGGERSESSLSGGLAWNTGLHHAWKAEIRMVEDIEKLRLKPQLHMLGQGEPFCQVEVTPEKIRTAQRVAAEVSELAILRVVATITLPGAGIDGRDESVGIEPLKCSWLCDARNRMVVIERSTGNDIGEFRPAALHNAVTTRRIGRAQT